VSSDWQRSIRSAKCRDSLAAPSDAYHSGSRADRRMHHEAGQNHALRRSPPAQHSSVAASHLTDSTGSVPGGRRTTPPLLPVLCRDCESHPLGRQWIRLPPQSRVRVDVDSFAASLSDPARAAVGWTTAARLLLIWGSRQGPPPGFIFLLLSSSTQAFSFGLRTSYCLLRRS